MSVSVRVFAARTPAVKIYGVCTYERASVELARCVAHGVHIACELRGAAVAKIYNQPFAINIPFPPFSFIQPQSRESLALACSHSLCLSSSFVLYACDEPRKTFPPRLCAWRSSVDRKRRFGLPGGLAGDVGRVFLQRRAVAESS